MAKKLILSGQAELTDLLKNCSFSFLRSLRRCFNVFGLFILVGEFLIIYQVLRVYDARNPLLNILLLILDHATFRRCYSNLQTTEVFTEITNF